MIHVNAITPDFLNGTNGPMSDDSCVHNLITILPLEDNLPIAN